MTEQLSSLRSSYFICFLQGEVALASPFFAFIYHDHMETCI